MSGKAGQKSGLSKDLPQRYALNLLEGVDGRCREPRRWRDRLLSLVQECGGTENLTMTDIEVLSRYVHHSRRMGKAEKRELLGEPVEVAAMNDGLRSWLGLLRQVEMIKARHRDGRDLAKDFEYALRAGEDE